MTRKSETTLWIAQRVSAAVLAVCVAVHLATIVYAVQGGLTAAEILGRKRDDRLVLVELDDVGRVRLAGGIGRRGALVGDAFDHKPFRWTGTGAQSPPSPGIDTHAA